MADATTATEGTIPFAVEGETYQIWYKLVGNINKSSHRPLVILHGGPGLSHDYHLPIGDLANASMPVIFYDQLGIGRSTHLPEKPTSFWTFDLFIDELINLVTALGVQDAFDVLGHSWGGYLALEFVIRRQHPGLRRLILTNRSPSTRLYHESERSLAEEFSQEEKDALAAGPDAGEKFMEATTRLLKLHGCLVDPLPEELKYSMSLGVPGSGDTTVFNAMSTGELRDWDATDRLHHIKVPALVVNGRADYMQDFVCAPFFHNVQRVRWITLENSTHTPFWEERDR